MTAWEAGRKQKVLFLAFAASACSDMFESPLRKPTRLKKKPSFDFPALGLKKIIQ